ncbi:MAG: endonuclease/exonuclease/phosphatase family protein [Verrucomicrobiales bacterium]|nr:endonuclease/exonuclease/phosphatase family protein [Verrucomicrobiales bacterium]
MKLILVLVLVLLTLASPHSLLFAEPVRVLSYNIHAGTGTDGVLDLERIAGVIKESKAEIVALQEVDKITKRSGGRDLASEVGELTGMEVVFGASMEYGGGHYGNAFLIETNAGWKIASSRTHTLPAPAGNEPRSVLEIQLTSERAGVPSLTVFSTHWCHRDEANRLAAARFVNALVAESNTTTFLIGDLNATPKSHPLTVLLEAGWKNPATAEVPTVPVISPQRQIDFVLLRSEWEWKALEVRALDDRPEASDHLPLVTVIEFLR